MLPLNDPDRLCTLDEVARELKVTKATARAVERRALFKVRLALEMRGISEREWFSHLHDLNQRWREW